MFPQLAQKGAEDRKPAVWRFNQIAQSAVHLVRDVVQRTQWFRCRERIAAADEHARVCAIDGEKTFNQSGLADAGLAIHQGDTAVPRGRLAKSVGESLQRSITLQQ